MPPSAGARLATASVGLYVGNNGGGWFDARRSAPVCVGLYYGWRGTVVKLLYSLFHKVI